MPSALPRFLACLASILLSIGTCGAGCDPLPDECEDDDNVCDGNVANKCERGAPDVRRKSSREDCGSSRTCMMVGEGLKRGPECVRGAGVECTTEGPAPCFGDLLSDCVRTEDGRLLLWDRRCFWEDTVCVGNTCKVK